MQRFLFIFLMCVGILTSANAQTFTQRIQKTANGQGTVVIHQSDSIDQLVNTAVLANRNVAAKPAATPAPPTKPTGNGASVGTPAQATPKQEAPVQKAQAEQGEESKGVSTYKAVGYRVQAFAGGNSRADRQKAEATRSTIKSHFPNVPVYVNFFSPRWICRVGNYRTYEEAHQMLVSLRNLGFDQCTIVKGKITVAY
ncbi:MAG: SPOR domain-containing protein [Prevotella sp.]|nr:SPOR domain-containing protein [Prevotella sp.]